MDDLNSTPQIRNPFFVLLAFIFIAMVGALVGSILVAVWNIVQGFDLQQAVSNLTVESTLQERNLVRVANLLGHFFAFTIPAVVIGWLFYKRNWLAYFKLDLFPKANATIAGIFFVLASFPFIQVVYWLNRQIPLPTWATALESATQEMIKGLLVMNSPAELLLNLLVIAVLPAVGEELVFRGVLQQQLQRVLRPALAIWVTAIVFSAIHFQFEGFLPRLVLGAALGYAFYWTGSLWIPIVAHFLTNGLQVIAQYVTDGELTEVEMQKTLDTSDWILGVGSLFLIIGIGYYLWKSKERGSIVQDN